MASKKVNRRDREVVGAAMETISNYVENNIASGWSLSIEFAENGDREIVLYDEGLEHARETAEYGMEAVVQLVKMSNSF